MPTSNGEIRGFIKHHAESLLATIPTEKRMILDIGCGKGTYSNILRKKLGGTWHGVEIFIPYVEDYNLASRYDVIHLRDARKFEFTEKYHMVFMGDVLEHMTKEEAVKLVKRALKSSMYVFISIPIRVSRQGPYKHKRPDGSTILNHNEIHVVWDWTHEKVMKTFPDVFIYEVGSWVGSYILRGKFNVKAQ